MTGKEYITNSFRLIENDRPAWLPFVGCHGAFLTGNSAQDYLSSSELVIKGIEAAIEKYFPDGLPVTFDLQLEAEALGCRLIYSLANPPAVVSHPLEEGIALNKLKIPEKDKGRIGEMLKAAETVCLRYSDIAFFGLVTGPFTLALHLMGTEIFTAMYENPQKAEEVIDFCSKVAIKMSDYYMESGCAVIAIVDPMTSQIDPFSFESFVSKPVSGIFEHIREKGALSSFFVCGQAEHNLELMAACRPDNICVDENISLKTIKEIALSNGISFGGNLKLTTTLLLGTPEDSERDALDCIITGGKKGFVLAPGCDLPMTTPVENMIAVSKLIRDEYRQEFLSRTSFIPREDTLPDLSGRWAKNRVVIDVVTLDSGSCAPCQYVMELVNRLKPLFGDKIEIFEHKIKTNEGILMMKSLGVKNIPTICMNGKIKFVSITPPIKLLKESVSEELR
ncbi:MAG: Uroporphyrinogen decarboxylase superfamily [uncultured bacterium]|nr:MAG: Uroporphyrinogen decarboxylase superfamily [uncultured bacterium]HBY02174.1 uroporphyrinogen decarboxylase [Rikenellaceae bacterium]